MQTTILDVSGNKSQPLAIDAAISFKPFIQYLEKRLVEERTVKSGLYAEALSQFTKANLSDKDIAIKEIHNYASLLEYVYACLSPASEGEGRLAWGLCFPFLPVAFYGTDLMYELLSKRMEGYAYEVTRTPEEYHRERLQLLYSFILKRLYNFQAPVKKAQYHVGLNKTTGLMQCYMVDINTDFVDVSAKSALPVIDFVQLYTHLSEGGGFEILEEMLPLALFKFRGICIMTVTDVTAEEAVNNIRKIRLTRTGLTDEESYQKVIQSLKSLVRNREIEFDLFPLLKVNDVPVFSMAKGGTGILFEVYGEHRLTAEEFRRQATAFAAKPLFFFSSDIFLETRKEYSFLEHFRHLGVKSLALMPIFHLHEPVGVMAVHTWGEHTFDEKVLALLEPAISPIGQLLRIYVDGFNLEIERVIKEKFTSIQPSVQWKFNEVAWNYIYHSKKNLPVVLGNILFEEVYPLYGAIDIRNSTVERNKAIIADIDNHLKTLASTLDSLQEFLHNDLLKEMIYHCQQWQQVITQEQLSSSVENEMYKFLEEEATAYLQHVASQIPESRKLINNCLENLDSNVNKNELEVSMQMINNAINDYFEANKHKLQESYPCYFEKFRTDGIEYDIYIGQSITPAKDFSHFHLKDLRLWQLSSMAAIAKLTHSLLIQMPRELYTTQLIFVHNQPIDISFRADERRFDVEGAYNIRYQMIKKRIDKVHIRNTEERLTQPGKIALIYSDGRDIEDFLPFIHYLQETGVLLPELEELELEDLQGLTGLKALRVGVTMPPL
ncbi:GAF domain-containing protein [Chitinophaga silvatica]|uniref:GAF domain-containing protein n=1 Tax=Chitinophaga silvatica TaxID=2282649 RepID=A0A3E1Y4L7_9BACT|nr:GAF domain-containing protein [Chitinophaga silvatica]RFS19619.1 GAF domain-containing protein [Chitinophaga silvatica]